MGYYNTLIATMDRKLNLELKEEYSHKYYKINYFMLKEALA